MSAKPRLSDIFRERVNPLPTPPIAPLGYTRGTAPDGQLYIVPTFMVPDLDQAFAAYRRTTQDLRFAVRDAAGGVSHLILLNWMA